MVRLRGRLVCLERRVFPGLVAVVAMAVLAAVRPAVVTAQNDRPGGTLVLEGAAAAAPAPQASAQAVRPMVRAVRLAEAPTIDGRLDDSMWRSAARIDKFVQQTPVEGAPATQQTDVYIGYDSEKLYFGIYAHYSDMGLMRANRVDRDKTDNDDIVTISFDPYQDKQRGYSFSVNGYGVQGDSILAGNSGPSRGEAGTSSSATGDITWDGLFASAGQIVEDGWTAEMAIPLKTLRYPARGDGEAHRWGFQVERQIRTGNETDLWAPSSRDVLGYLANMGIIDGMSNLSTSRNFEVLPTITTVRQHNLNRTTGAMASTNANDFGLNVKYGLTPTLTFDFTVNPDFSQIESDKQQIEVNQRFPIQYPELRPFFLEGSDNFQAGGPATYIHTRTIVDPEYGAKLSGKIGKATIGFALANDRAPGKVDDPRDPAFGKTANIVLARARWDYRPQSWIGVVANDREFLTSSSRLIGIDAPTQLGQNTSLHLAAIYSHHKDLAGVLKRGFVTNTFLRKSGRNVGWTIYHFEISTNYANDLGFVNRLDQSSTGGNFSYKWWPENWIVNWSPQYSGQRNYDHKGNLQNVNHSGTVTVQFANNINASASTSHNMERYREINFVKDRMKVSGTVNANRRILFTGSIDQGEEIRFTVNPYLGRNRIYSVSSTVRPFSRLQAVINLDTTNFTDTRTNTEAFDIKILRLQTTYQFTSRLLLRNIMQRNTFNKTLDANVLLTYRVNSGTAFYVGYDDHYAQGDAINANVFPATEFERTNRAIFAKVQYLFRNN